MKAHSAKGASLRDRLHQCLNAALAFVPLTLGLSFLLAIMESVWVMTGRTIWRDMTRNFDNFRARLERDANDVVDHILRPNHADDDGGFPRSPTCNKKISE